MSMAVLLAGYMAKAGSLVLLIQSSFVIEQGAMRDGMVMWACGVVLAVAAGAYGAAA